MKRQDFINLALTGIATGALVASPLAANAAASNGKTNGGSASTHTPDEDRNEGNVGYHVMSEDELLLQLTPEGVKMYQSLDAKGKGLALLVASSRCDGTNECKGLNACQTEKNDCAGKGPCKGQGKCAFSDKNLAVKLVRDKMAGKRANVSTPAAQKNHNGR